MTRPAFALFLLAAFAPTIASSSDATPAKADSRQVAEAFADICMHKPHAWAATQAAKVRGAVPVAGADAAPPPGAPMEQHFTMDIDGVPARIVVSDAECSVDVASLDVRAMLKRFDRLIEKDYSGLRRYKPAQDRPEPSSGTVVRDVHYAVPGDGFGLNLLAVATGEPGAEGLVMARRFVSVATGEVQAIDFPASEDLSGRALAPPRYPNSALRACAGGLVFTLVRVDDQGAVLEVVVEKSSGRDDLDAAAVDAVRQWRFFPGILKGVLVGGQVRVPVNFESRCGR